MFKYVIICLQYVPAPIVHSYQIVLRNMYKQYNCNQSNNITVSNQIQSNNISVTNQQCQAQM